MKFEGSTIDFSCLTLETWHLKLLPNWLCSARSAPAGTRLPVLGGELGLFRTFGSSQDAKDAKKKTETTTWSSLGDLGVFARDIFQIVYHKHVIASEAAVLSPPATTGGVDPRGSAWGGSPLPWGRVARIVTEFCAAHVDVQEPRNIGCRNRCVCEWSL